MRFGSPGLDLFDERPATASAVSTIMPGALRSKNIFLHGSLADFGRRHFGMEDTDNDIVFRKFLARCERKRVERIFG